AFAGGGAGAVAGGLIGALVGAGIPEENAKAYHEALREGGVVIGVVPHNKDDATAIEKEFRDLKGDNVCYCYPRQRGVGGGQSPRVGTRGLFSSLLPAWEG